MKRPNAIERMRECIKNKVRDRGSAYRYTTEELDIDASDIYRMQEQEFYTWQEIVDFGYICLCEWRDIEDKQEGGTL